MRLALREAARALEHDDVPIGAVIVHDGEVIGAGPQRARGPRRPHRPRRDDRPARGRPRARQLAGARRRASTSRSSRARCAPARSCWPGSPASCSAATDPKAGAAGSVFDVLDEPRLNHRPQVQSGLLAEECADLLRAFFASRR